MKTKKEELDRAIDYFNSYGYYIVTSPGQQELADELVKTGFLRKADPAWFIDGLDHSIYVHPYVDRKEKMPAVIYKLLYEKPYKKGEHVNVDFTNYFGTTVKVLGKITRLPFFQKNGKQTVEVLVYGDYVIVPIESISQTYEE